LPRNSNLKLEVYANASAQLIPEIASNEAKVSKSCRALAKKKKEEAEKPFYLNRI